MKLTQKQGEKFAEFIAAFLINAIIFGISAIFTEISFGGILLYSFINATWMTFLLFPILPSITKLFERKRKRYELNQLLNYIKDFEIRQVEIYKESLDIEQKEKLLLEKYKFDWKLFRKYIKRNDINCLYHFTDKSNLDSIIKNNGLYSQKFCIENNIIVNKPGGDELSHQLDKKANLDNFIRLSFTANHPMMYYALKEGRLSNPVILKIDSEVIYWLHSKYSDSNATSKYSKIRDDFKSLSVVDLKYIKSVDYFDSIEEKRKFYQAEILVREHIPIKFIKNVYEYKGL